MSESGGFDFTKFINDSKLVLTNPKEYFSGMAKEGGFVEPVIKAVIYGLVAGIITFIWGLLSIAPAASGMGAMFGGAVGVMAIVGAVVFAIIGLFIGGLITLIISAICGGSTQYEANVRVTASMMVLSPVQALFSFTGAIHFYLGAVIGLLISLYGLYLFYNALVNALEAKEGTSKVVAIILAVLVALGTIMSFKAQKAASSFSKQAEQMMEESGLSSDEAQEAMKALEQIQKELEKQQ